GGDGGQRSRFGGAARSIAGAFPWQLEPSERRTYREARNSSDRWLSEAVAGNCQACIFALEAHSRGRASSPARSRSRRWQAPLSPSTRVSIGFSLCFGSEEKSLGEQVSKGADRLYTRRFVRHAEVPT